MARRVDPGRRRTDTGLVTLRVPLVRVEGMRFKFHPELTLTPERFAGAADLQCEARDDVARKAELEYGFDASLYFFAGVAHPDFGDVVLAYDPERSSSLEGSATTFDTGGMFLGKIKGHSLSTPEARRGFVESDCHGLQDWRHRTNEWIDLYFDAAESYVDGIPKPDANEPWGGRNANSNLSP